jgi:hypothetical protein
LNPRGVQLLAINLIVQIIHLPQFIRHASHQPIRGRVPSGTGVRSKTKQAGAANVECLEHSSKPTPQLRTDNDRKENQELKRNAD